jgi:hypothetical protein
MSGERFGPASVDAIGVLRSLSNAQLILRSHATGNPAERWAHMALHAISRRSALTSPTNASDRHSGGVKRAISFSTLCTISDARVGW